MTLRPPVAAFAALAALALASCATSPFGSAYQEDARAYWSALASHCGKAYAGGLVSDDARDADWAGKRMIAHWAECDEDRIAIAFHVADPEAPDGWNRSRTWVVTKAFLLDQPDPHTIFTLKHDHRHEDGSVDTLTNYGGTTQTPGSVRGQDYPADWESRELFRREGLEASLTNLWRVEVDPAGTPDARFAYQLTRRGDPTRLFRVEMDASTPIAPPPPAWGW
jgi:hypothetical protein